MTNRSALLCLSILAAAPAARAAGGAHGHVLDNGRVHVVLADPASGFTTANSNRVDSISWIDSGGASTGNLVAQGGPLHCNDPQEYFGQAYGDGGDAHPFLVVAGDTAKWKGKAGQTLTGKTKVNVAKLCDYTPDGTTSSTYSVSTKSAAINQLSVQRTYVFKTVSNSSDLRAYVPRLPIGAYSAVLWPNASGTIQHGDANNCSGGCLVTDWNGTWFAEQNSAGQGLVVLRKAAGLPAVLVFDNDSFSASNNSAVALSLPTGGWLGTYREQENLCFYDATTWPAASQAAGTLPTGCSAP